VGPGWTINRTIYREERGRKNYLSGAVSGRLRNFPGSRASGEGLKEAPEEINR